MNIILLSGGSGKRLWPLSNDIRSKQFLKIFTNNDGTRESMVQRMIRMINANNPEAKITIATAENQIPQIRSQVGDEVSISVEPSRRDTFPAIVLASAYLKKCGVGLEEPVVICPVDPYVEEDYFKCLNVLADHVEEANLTLMGIEPTYPSQKYGYIIPDSHHYISSVKEFKEKPDACTAEKYIREGALWNAGVFAFKLSYLMSIAKELFGTDEYDKMYSKYASLPKISFDYAVVEKEKHINVVRYSGQWKDLGTWNTLTEAMHDLVSGKATVVDCKNTHVINELGIPLIALGMNNTVIAATADGILVSDKETSPKLKDYVATARPMYERRVWGEYRVLDYKHSSDGNNSLVKELIISPGQHISYQRHKHRTEMWTLTQGHGELILDDYVRRVKRGDVVAITPGTKHAIKGITELHLIEVQLGDELTEDDVERLDWNWNEM